MGTAVQPQSRRTKRHWQTTEELPQSFSFPSLRLVSSSRRARRIAWMLVILLLAMIPAMLFLPWQQSVRGSGRVVAYAPLDRQQTIEAPLSGRIVSWGEGIIEGARVEAGQKILEIRDLDPELTERLDEQRVALETKLSFARLKADAYRAQVEAYTSARDSAIEAATEQVKVAEQKVQAEQRNLDGAVADELQKRLNLERQTTLAREGIASRLTREVAEREHVQAVAKVEMSRAYLEAAKNEESSKRAELNQKAREAQAKIDAAQAYFDAANGDVASAQKDVADIKVKVARQQSQTVTSPRDGFLLRLDANQGGELVKQGDPLFTLVPDTADRAVEIWVNGNDAPLITSGRHVRLQFEGWPAVQFAGWPSVAVGTFGGTVSIVDATDNGRGEFRVLIVPDSEDQPWPADRFLRQGVRANGWVLLDQVSLGYELWRQLNGFPQSVSQKDGKGSDAGGPFKKDKK